MKPRLTGHVAYEEIAVATNRQPFPISREQRAIRMFGGGSGEPVRLIVVGVPKDHVSVLRHKRYELPARCDRRAREFSQRQWTPRTLGKRERFPNTEYAVRENRQQVPSVRGETTELV